MKYTIEEIAELLELRGYVVPPQFYLAPYGGGHIHIFNYKTKQRYDFKTVEEFSQFVTPMINENKITEEDSVLEI